MSFLRLKTLKETLNKQNDDYDEYFNVIGMITSKINSRKLPNGSIKFEFSIIQTEHDGFTPVTYISNCQEQELKFCKLFQPVGTICFMSDCQPNGYGLELSHHDDMAAVVFRPNEYQVNQFLKVNVCLQ